MATKKTKATVAKTVETLTHAEATRKNIPTARVPVGHAEGRTNSGPDCPMNGGTATSTRSWSGAGRMTRTGAT